MVTKWITQKLVFRAFSSQVTFSLFFTSKSREMKNGHFENVQNQKFQFRIEKKNAKTVNNSLFGVFKHYHIYGEDFSNECTLFFSRHSRRFLISPNSFWISGNIPPCFETAEFILCIGILFGFFLVF